MNPPLTRYNINPMASTLSGVRPHYLGLQGLGRQDGRRGHRFLFSEEVLLFFGGGGGGGVGSVGVASAVQVKLSSQFFWKKNHHNYDLVTSSFFTKKIQRKSPVRFIFVVFRGSGSRPLSSFDPWGSRPIRWSSTWFLNDNQYQVIKNWWLQVEERKRNGTVREKLGKKKTTVKTDGRRRRRRTCVPYMRNDWADWLASFSLYMAAAREWYFCFESMVRLCWRKNAVCEGNKTAIRDGKRKKISSQTSTRDSRRFCCRRAACCGSAATSTACRVGSTGRTKCGRPGCGAPTNSRCKWKCRTWRSTTSGSWLRSRNTSADVPNKMGFNQSGDGPVSDTKRSWQMFRLVKWPGPHWDLEVSVFAL